jgi:uncharacterized damage-inducible protein DinB
MQLKSTGQAILSQIHNLTSQLNDAEFSTRLELLNENTIGKHVRHIIEFFELLISGCDSGIINYDNRKHDEQLETSTKATMTKIEELKSSISALALEEAIFLEVSYSKTDEEKATIKTSIGRELAYNIEHAIHHMAIIKIAIHTVFPQVKLADNFGVAYSTVRFHKLTDQ